MKKIIPLILLLCILLVGCSSQQEKDDLSNIIKPIKVGEEIQYSSKHLQEFKALSIKDDETYSLINEIIGLVEKYGEKSDVECVPEKKIKYGQDNIFAFDSLTCSTSSDLALFTLENSKESVQIKVSKEEKIKDKNKQEEINLLFEKVKKLENLVEEN